MWVCCAHWKIMTVKFILYEMMMIFTVSVFACIHRNDNVVAIIKNITCSLWNILSRFYFQAVTPTTFLRLPLHLLVQTFTPGWRPNCQHHHHDYHHHHHHQWQTQFHHPHHHCNNITTLSTLIRSHPSSASTLPSAPPLSPPPPPPSSSSSSSRPHSTSLS